LGENGKGSCVQRREWMRRDRKSCWEGEQWILAQEKEGEVGESRDEKMMKVKLIV
jgi:hypothetical protein